MRKIILLALLFQVHIAAQEIPKHTIQALTQKAMELGLSKSFTYYAITHSLHSKDKIGNSIYSATLFFKNHYNAHHQFSLLVGIDPLGTIILYDKIQFDWAPKTN